MTTKLTIQAVSGAIRATKGIITSAKYSGSSRRLRSNGAYAEVRRFSGEIVIDYWTGGYQHAYTEAKTMMPKVIAALEAKGFKVVEKQERSDMTRKYLVVELADSATDKELTEQLIKNCEANPFIDDQTIEALKASIA